MKILSSWLRSFVPGISVSDRQLADDLTLRGIAVDGVFDLRAGGSVFEMDITTNRVDAMNHYGIAREAATIYGLELQPVDAALPTAKPAARAFPVSIEDPTRCGRFTARVLRDVKIAPSTGMVAERFRMLEQKPISNAVDATNYILLAMGHPTHAFDLDKLQGGIIVRRARKGEKLVTLDGVERTLDPDDLVVADERGPVGLAGVMGGMETAISASTKNILVEAAWFDQGSVRRSSKRHLIHTDASHRFERGADFNAAPLANALVSRIILESGGSIEGELVDVVIPEVEERTARRAAVSFALSEVQRILGATEDEEGITAPVADAILSGLGCGLIAAEPGPAWSVTLPSWRLDLEREIDLIEEVARVYGYNRFRNTLPDFSGTVVELPWAEKESTIRRTLLAQGWTEAISSTFCSASDAALFVREPNSAVAIGNPLSEEAGMLRPSLVPGMLSMLALNISRDVEGAALFEMGTVFSGSPERVDERPALAIGATGRAFSGDEADFYDLKGAMERVISQFAARSLYFDRFPAVSGLAPAWLHPGRSARAVLEGATVGWFGELHPAECERRKLKQRVLAGEIWLDRLYQQPLRQRVVRELSRFQPVRRDFSLIVPDAVPYGVLEQAVRALGIAELQSVAPKEVLRDAKGVSIPAGHYSLLLGVVFQSPDHTLREEETQAWSQRVVAAVEQAGARLRG